MLHAESYGKRVTSHYPEICDGFTSWRRTPFERMLGSDVLVYGFILRHRKEILMAWSTSGSVLLVVDVHWHKAQRQARSKLPVDVLGGAGPPPR